MSRIRAIVDQGKQDLDAVSDQKIRDGIAPSKNSGNALHRYNMTKSVPVSAQTLLENRLIAHDKTNPVTKQFQVLRAKILQEMRNKKWSTIAITAPTPNAGKSLVSANLALSMALEGNQSVLLVDMDLSKPSIHQYFGIQPEFGMQDFFDGTSRIEDILINPGIDRLVLFPGKKSIVNSSEQVSSQIARNMVKELKSRYEARIVIFDLPPILGSDEVMVFLPYVDCSLLVVEAGKNSPKEVEKSLEAIGSNPLLGTVLNKSEHAWPVPAYY